MNANDNKPTVHVEYSPCMQTLFCTCINYQLYCTAKRTIIAIADYCGQGFLLDFNYNGAQWWLLSQSPNSPNNLKGGVVGEKVYEMKRWRKSLEKFEAGGRRLRYP